MKTDGPIANESVEPLVRFRRHAMAVNIPPRKRMAASSPQLSVDHGQVDYLQFQPLQIRQVSFPTSSA